MGEKQKRRSLSDEERLKAFVLRGRRIASHSLCTEKQQLMEELRRSTMNVTILKNHLTGEVNYVMREELPEEEALESLAARIRPLILESEDLYYAKVLKSIAALVPPDRFPDYVEPIEEWKAHWDRVATRDSSVQAYSVITDRGMASDQDLMYAWLYGDVVHADDKEHEAKGLSITQRYKAAAQIIARIVECAEATLLLIQALIDEGELVIDSELFDRPVVVGETVFEHPITNFRSADTQAPLPLTNDPVDPQVWKAAEDAIADLIPSPTSCEAFWHRRGRTLRPRSSGLGQQVLIESDDIA